MGVLSEAVATSVLMVNKVSTFEAIDGFEGLWFKSIPPERIGLNGEFDYYGLAKRVQSHLQEKLGNHWISRLRVRQRGRVIILSGCLHTLDELSGIVKLVLAVEGVDTVETRAVTIQEICLAVS